MALPPKPSPRGIITYLQLTNQTDVMQSGDSVRKFCRENYPSIDFRVVESTVREARAHKNKATREKKKFDNMLPGMKIPGYNC